MNTVIDIY